MNTERDEKCSDVWLLISSLIIFFFLYQYTVIHTVVTRIFGVSVKFLPLERKPHFTFTR